MKSGKFAEKLIDAALDSGAEKAEIYLSEKHETEITIAGEKPESVNMKTDCGYGLRVLVDSKLGFYSSSQMEEFSAIENIHKLVKATRLHTPDPFNIIPEKSAPQMAPIKEIFDPTLQETPLSAKITTAIEVEKAGKAYDSRIGGFVWILYGDVAESYRVINSSGIDITSSATTCFGFAYGYASNGKAVQTGRFAKAYGYFDQFDSKEIGEKAARYAIRMLDARDFKGSSLKGLFPPEAGIPLIYSLFGMIEADSIQKGKSPFRDKLGRKVASAIVNIIDDGTLTGGLASRPYDSEGIPTTMTPVIESGILRNYLYDSYTAKKGNTRSTGNASRIGYQGKPTIHPTNFYLRPGQENPAQILKAIESGIMITELSGLHAGINYATADFSVPAKGIIIEKGALTEPVDNISISGNLFDFLNKISAIGDDLTWEPADGMIGAPTFLVDDLKVIGRG